MTIKPMFYRLTCNACMWPKPDNYDHFYRDDPKIVVDFANKHEEEQSHRVTIWDSPTSQLSREIWATSEQLPESMRPGWDTTTPGKEYAERMLKAWEDEGYTPTSNELSQLNY